MRNQRIFRPSRSPSTHQPLRNRRLDVKRASLTLAGHSVQTLPEHLDGRIHASVSRICNLSSSSGARPRMHPRYQRPHHASVGPVEQPYIHRLG